MNILKKEGDKNYILTLLFIWIIGAGWAQNVGVNETGAAPDASAILDAASTSKGLLLPRMTAVERDAIVSPSNSLLIFNTTSNCLQIYIGSLWMNIQCECDPPIAPEATAATNINTTSFDANWNASASATGYYLDVDDNSDFSSPLAGYNNLSVGAVTTYSVSGLTDGVTYYYRVRAENSCGTSGNSSAISVTTGCSISLTNLQAYYKFNESSGNIINQSPTPIASSDLVVTGATYGATGQIGNALSFDGVNDHADATGSTAASWNFFNQDNAVWTVAFWVQYDNFTLSHDIFGTTNFNVGDIGVLLRTNTDGTLRIFCGHNGVDRYNQTTTGAIPNDNNWHFVAITFQDGVSCRVRIDGGTFETLAAPALTNTSNPESPFAVGYDNGNALWHAGDLDEVSVWSRILSDAEVDCLYNSGSGKEL